MSFTVEKTKTGKPCISFNNMKYRQHHILKSGDISWRCLGRNCGATIKTDSSMGNLTICNDKHSGEHPVTMRRLAAKTPITPPATSASPAAGSPIESPVYSPALLPACSTPTPSPPKTLSATIPSSMSVPVSFQPTTPMQDLAEENKHLKEKIDELKEQVSVVLNHAIESDTRLLEFTDQVFVSNSSGSSTLPTSALTMTVDCGVQCEPYTCKDRSCMETRDLVRSLRTTIEVLEAEIECLRSERKTGECDEKSEWVVVKQKQNKTKSKSIFNVPLSKQKTKQTLTRKPKRNNTKPENRTDNRKQLNRSCDKEKINFKTVTIRGDSHARHVAGLVGELVESAVTGVCKPGAQLRDIWSPNMPSPVDGPHCEVLMAGTNDLATGKQQNVYRHLEQLISSRPANTSLVIATLPHRHDLPGDDAINQETALVNAFIEELATRKSIQVLDFNKIKRKMFTRHGMHLTHRGKRQLARLLVQTIVHAGARSSSAASASQTSPTSLQTTLRSSQVTAASAQHHEPAEPLTLHFDSYAEAVKVGVDAVNSSQKNCIGAQNLAVG